MDILQTYILTMAMTSEKPVTKGQFIKAASKALLPLGPESNRYAVIAALAHLHYRGMLKRVAKDTYRTSLLGETHLRLTLPILERLVSGIEFGDFDKPEEKPKKKPVPVYEPVPALKPEDTGYLTPPKKPEPEVDEEEEE